MTDAKVVRPSHDIRRRLLAGEVLTATQVADDYDASSALLGTVIKRMRADGHTIVRGPHQSGEPSPVHVDGAHVNRADWGKAEGVVKLSGDRPARATSTRHPSARTDTERQRDRERKARYRAQASGSPLPERVTAPAPAKRNGKHSLPDLPSLGASVSVCLLAVGEDGRVSIGLRSDAGTWLTSVDGFSAASDDA